MRNLNDRVDPNAGKSIPIGDIEYLSFEGGGGKGIIYLGALRSLEEKLRGRAGVPIIDYVNEPTPAQRQIKGISGASAGSITAFMVALGMSTDDIQKELMAMAQTELGNEQTGSIFSYVTTVPLPRTFKARKVILGKFETFFDTMHDDVLYQQRVVMGNERVVRMKTEKRFKFWVRNGLNLVDEFLLEDDNRGDFLYEKIFKTPVKTSDGERLAPENYVYSLVAHRGLFSGLNIRNYFRDLLTRQLNRRLKSVDARKKQYRIFSADQITFKHFYNYFGVDFVVAGTNISQNEPRYFSLFHTPDFPVIEAVALSMNIPGVFKPIYVEHAVHELKDYDSGGKYNKTYTGLYGDGGMLNNFPLHAFDKIEKFDYGVFDFLVDDKYSDVEVAANDPYSSASFNKKVLGFRLENFSGFNAEIRESDIINTFPDEYFKILPYLGNLFNSFMYSGGSGQIRSQEEENHTVYLNTDDLGLLDFAPLPFPLDFNRQSYPLISFDPKYPKYTGTVLPSVKLNRILEAYRVVDKAIYKNILFRRAVNE